MGNFKISDTRRQERYSIGYLASIAAIAGYDFSEPPVDEDSIDVHIIQRGDAESDGQDYPNYPLLSIQAKCTYGNQPNPNTQAIHLQVSRKTYQDLIRVRRTNPRILVAVYTPRLIDRSIEDHTGHIRLYNTAHWVSLRGREPLPPGQESTIVRIPLEQRFTVSELRRMMDGIARAETEDQIRDCFGGTS